VHPAAIAALAISAGTLNAIFSLQDGMWMPTNGVKGLRLWEIMNVYEN
jgi:hypothetical protein